MKNRHPSISVPRPCTADWNRMTPCSDGRHCKACNKIVVDFTQMDKAVIKNYFELRVGEKICGHFKKEQIAQKEQGTANDFELVPAGGYPPKESYIKTTYAGFGQCYAFSGRLQQR